MGASGGVGPELAGGEPRQSRQSSLFAASPAGTPTIATLQVGPGLGQQGSAAD